MYSSRPQSDYSKSQRSHSEQNRSRHYRKDSDQSRSRNTTYPRRETNQSYHIPTADQINKLVQQVFEPYEPERWSVLDERDQHTIQKIIYHTPLIDLSIRRVLQVSRLSETPSTIAFISDCIIRKFNSLPQ